MKSQCAVKSRRANLPQCGLGTQGLVSLYVAIIFVAFMLLTGLVADGAQLRQERRQLDDLAARISRVIAQEVDLQAWHQDQQIILDPTKAQAAGRQLLDDHNLDGTIAISEASSQVTVTLQRRISPALSVIPARTISASRTAEATIRNQTN